MVLFYLFLSEKSQIVFWYQYPEDDIFNKHGNWLRKESIMQ